MLAQPAQSEPAVGRAALIEDAVIELDLRVMLAVGVALLGVARGQEHADSGHLVADEGEVLAAAARLAARELGHIHCALAHKLGHIGHCISGEGVVHHHAGAIVAESDPGGAAVGRRHALCDLGHPLVDQLTDLVFGVDGADGAPCRG